MKTHFRNRSIPVAKALKCLFQQLFQRGLTSSELNQHVYSSEKEKILNPFKTDNKEFIKENGRCRVNWTIQMCCYPCLSF